MDRTFTQLQNIGRMVECGIHSGLPACCVKFFITDITWMHTLQANDYRKKIRARSEALNISWAYIPCRDCLRTGKVVKVLPCPANSHCYYISERPENIPSVEETDRPLAHRLKRSFATFLTGFNAMRKKHIPVDGIVADHMERTLIESIGLIDKAIVDMQYGAGESLGTGTAKHQRDMLNTQAAAEEALRMIRDNRLLLKNISIENKR